MSVPTSSPRSRRRLCTAASAAACTLLVAGRQVKADDFSTVDQRVTAQLLSSVPSASTVQGYMSTLQSNGSWSDVTYTNTSQTNWLPMTHLTRLEAMAQDYASSSSSLYHNATLAADISSAYNYWISANPQSSNWWYNDIGSLQSLGGTMVLFGSNLTTAQLNSGNTFLARAHSAIPTYGSGQNMVDLAIVGIDQGLATNSSSTVSTAYSEIGGTIVITPGGGIQYDDSYQFHGPQLYIGGYGQLYDEDVLNEASISAGTSFAITTAQQDLIIDQLLDGTQWFIRGRALDITASGRGDSRAGFSTAGTSYVSGIEDALALGTYRTTELQSFLNRQQAASSSGVASSTQNTLSGNRGFYDSDIMVQQRPAYYESVKISSVRTSQPETGNGEGLTNLYLGDGVNQIMMTGQEYNNIEPVWNWRMLPGTTVEQDTRSLTPSTAWGMTGTATYAVGVSDGTYGAEAFNYSRFDVSAKKSWYFFDNEEVALGSAIASSNKSYAVYTTLNQCLLTSTVSYETSASSTVQNLSTGTVTPAGLKWVYQGGVGYFFISPVSNATIQAISQTGSWSEINTSQSTTPVTENVFSLFINHGTAVSNGSYSYIVVPNMTEAGMDAYAAANPIQVINNDSKAQAVYQSTLGITQTAFYAADTVTIAAGETLAANGSSMVMLQQYNNGLKLSASNPQNAQANLNVTLVGVGLSGSSSTWLDSLGSAVVGFNLPGGSLAGSTVGLTLTSDGAATPTVTLSSNDDETKFTYNVSSPVVLPASTTFSGDQFTTLTFAKPISGNAGLTFSGAGTTVNLLGTNSYTGLTTVTSGTVNVAGNQTAAIGGWSIGNNLAQTPVMVSFQSGSGLVIAAGNSFSIAMTNSNAAGATANFAGPVVDNGSLSIGRAALMNLGSGTVWTQNGSMSETLVGGTSYNTALTISSGASLTYNGSTAITLSPSPGASGSATITVTGGTLTTGQGFSDTTSTGSGAANLILNSGATLKLTANVPALTATAGSNFNVQLGTGGATINTQAYNTSIASPISQTGSLTKLGTGTLILAGNNNYSGGTIIGNGDGVVQISNPSGLGTGPVTLSKSGTSSGTLQLNLTGTNTIANTINGFNSTTFSNDSTVPDIENVAGNNTITSNLTVTSTGGNGVSIQSDSGLLTLTGTITTTLTYRGVELNGAGNGVVSGPVTNSTTGYAFSLYKDGTGNWTLTHANNYSSGTMVDNGSLTFAAPGAFPAYTALTIAANASAIAANHGNGANNNLFASSLKLSGTLGAWTGKLDLSDNDLDVQSGSLTTLNDQVKQGYNANGQGLWNGNAGIGSSAAATDTTHLTALGVIQNSTNGSPTGTALYGSGTALGLFDGTSPANSDVLIKYTYYGDANLDGKVDGSDYSRIDSAMLNPQLTGWYNGDFNYDGVINGSDYTLLDNAFNTQSAIISDAIADPFATATAQIATTNPPIQAVPEPTSLAIAGLGIVTLLGRKPRQAHLTKPINSPLPG